MGGVSAGTAGGIENRAIGELREQILDDRLLQRNRVVPRIVIGIGPLGVARVNSDLGQVTGL